ncbi:MAG: hypothetical protein LBM77_07310 [Spirochaetaceae bacterium]|jgi:hypothetical protein|nr:hypothetical protein [Spirochaetaceae bacterium]
MKYVLMHKKEPVSLLNITTQGRNAVLKAETVYNKSLIPPGIYNPNGILNMKNLSIWFFSRGIPATRDGLSEALPLLNAEDSHEILLRSHGLSLTDHYWFQKPEENLDWSEINFFQNDFSDDIGKALFGKIPKSLNIDFNSPDAASAGNLKKRWTIHNGIRKLIKGGEGSFFQEPFNEQIASWVMDRLGLENTKYTIGWENNEPLCICSDFVDINTEFISATFIANLLKKRNDDSFYEHYITCCSAYGIDARPSLDKMLVADYIIGNRDRHLNNFGIIRNADNLQWIKPAPVYDSGASLWSRQAIPNISSKYEIPCMPFGNNHSDQILLVKTLPSFDLDCLTGIDEFIKSTFSKNPYMPLNVINLIATEVPKRIENLKIIAAQMESGVKLNPQVSKNFYKSSHDRDYQKRPY